MNWINIKTQLPTEIPDGYLSSHCCFDDSTSVLVYGYDHINFSPRYRVMFINDVARAKPGPDGNYVIDELIVTHWQEIERPK
jgi:hypothetical protein